MGEELRIILLSLPFHRCQISWVLIRIRTMDISPCNNTISHARESPVKSVQLCSTRGPCKCRGAGTVESVMAA